MRSKHLSPDLSAPITGTVLRCCSCVTTHRHACMPCILSRTHARTSFADIQGKCSFCRPTRHETDRTHATKRGTSVYRDASAVSCRTPSSTARPRSPRSSLTVAHRHNLQLSQAPHQTEVHKDQTRPLSRIHAPVTSAVRRVQLRHRRRLRAQMRQPRHFVVDRLRGQPTHMRKQRSARRRRICIADFSLN